MGRKLTADEKAMVAKWARKNNPEVRKAEDAGKSVRIVVDDELGDDGRMRYRVDLILITEGVEVPPPSN